MALNEFKKARIALNKADDAIFQRVLAKEGDTNGRELEVQITDGYVVESMANIRLNLYWKHLSLGNQGIQPFTAVDASKGVFKVSYPAEMLNAGSVQCFIQIQDGNSVTNTQNFVVNVQGSGFNATSAIASNEYKALTDALIKVGQYQSQIDTITADLKKRVNDLIAAEQREFDSIQSAFAPELKALQSQFDAVIAGATVDAELISARTSGVTGKSYTSAAKRIDEAEKMTVVFDDTGRRFVTSLELYKGKPRLNIEEVKE